MHSTPIVIATPKLANSACISWASPSSAICTEAGSAGEGGQGARFGVHVAQRAAAQLDVERDVAAAVQAVDLGRAAFHRDVATLASSTGPFLPGTVRRPMASRSARTRPAA
jgi:hypothetical protein